MFKWAQRFGGKTYHFALGISLALGGPAIAAGPPSFACPVNSNCATLTPVQLFELASQLASVSRFDAAQKLLESLSENPDENIRAEARFRLGNLFQATGDLQGAVRVYRRLLDDKPEATPVRLELARVLVRLGEEDKARSQLRRASAAGLPADVARVVDIFQLALRSRRRWGGAVEASLAPDTNINRATARSSVNIGSSSASLSKDAQAQSGLGGTVSAQIFYRPELNQNTNLLITSSLNGDFYVKSRFNDIAASVGVGPELLRGRSRYRFSFIASKRWFGGSPYSVSYGTSFNWLRQINPVSQIQLDLSSSKSSFEINPSLSGATHSAVLRFERALSPRLSYRTTLQAERQEARDPAFAAWSTGGELLVSRDVGRRTIYVRTAFRRMWGDAAFTLPPARRNDRLKDLEIGCLLRDLSVSGFAPVIRIHHTNNQSPLFFYDFRRTRVEFGLTREL